MGLVQKRQIQAPALKKSGESATSVREPLAQQRPRANVPIKMRLKTFALRRESHFSPEAALVHLKTFLTVSQMSRRTRKLAPTFDYWLPPLSVAEAHDRRHPGRRHHKSLPGLERRGVLAVQALA